MDKMISVDKKEISWNDFYRHFLLKQGEYCKSIRCGVIMVFIDHPINISDEVGPFTIRTKNFNQRECELSQSELESISFSSLEQIISFVEEHLPDANFWGIVDKNGNKIAAVDSF